jgi:hypothetical protein
MRIAQTACIAMVAGLLAAPAVAEQQPAAIDEATIDTRVPPVSLDRIKRRMAALPTGDERLLLRLTARVDVYARARAVEVLQGFNVESWPSLLGGRTGGAIAYGSPTHNETVNAMTPAFWRQRASSLAGIGVGW